LSAFVSFPSSLTVTNQSSQTISNGKITIDNNVYLSVADREKMLRMTMQKVEDLPPLPGNTTIFIRLLSKSQTVTTTLTDNLSSFISPEGPYPYQSLSITFDSALNWLPNLSELYVPYFLTFTSAAVTITYDYTPAAIPEPLTIGGAFVGAIFGTFMKLKLNKQ
jgi:hypothetical protein